MNDIVYQWDQDSWFLVDLDNYLFEAKQALGHANWFYHLVQERIDGGMTKDEAVSDVYPLWVDCVTTFLQI